MSAGVEWLGAGMQIALIGTGKIGGTLGKKWQQAGHQVVYASRNPRDDGPGGAPVVEVGQAIAGADVVVFAIPGPAVAEVAAEHSTALAGKVVVDATNRMGGPVVNNRTEIVAAAPDAKYVRAFNTLGWENFAEPLANADLFFAADSEARATAETLIDAIGLRPQYLGDATRRRQLTPSCRCGSRSRSNGAATAKSRCASSTHDPRAPLRTFALGDLGDELRHDNVQIANDTEVGELEDRRLGVLVDGHDRLRRLHARTVLDGTRDPAGDVELRRDGDPGLPDLCGVRVPTGIGRGA